MNQTNPLPALGDSARPHRRGPLAYLRGASNLYILLVLIALLVLFSAISPNHAFFDAGNLLNIVWDSAETLLLAVGETFVIITAGIDLSVGTVLIAGIASDAFYISMNRGAQMEAKKLGATVQFSGSPAAFSPSTQLPYLNAAIAQKPDLILIAPTDKVALQAPIQKAVSAGIPVILVDTTLSDPSIAVTTISSDNVAGGVAAGEALAKAVGKKGKVAGVSVAPGISTTDQRLQGFDMTIKKYPGMTNIGTTFAGDNTTRAASILKGLVAAHKDLAGVFAMNVVTGDGVTAAAREAGVGGKLKLVEFDAGPSQVQGLKAGTITALIAQEPLMIGMLGVRYGIQRLNGNKSLKKHYGTPSVVVTKSNVNDPSVAQFLYTK